MIIDAARHSTDFLQAFIASEEMDNAARYLQAGRRFAALSNTDLKGTWADAWRAYYEHCHRQRWDDCIDAAGELTVRGVPRPDHLIPPDSRRRIAGVIRHERGHPDFKRKLRDRYDDFMRRCTVWRN